LTQRTILRIFRDSYDHEFLFGPARRVESFAEWIDIAEVTPGQLFIDDRRPRRCAVCCRTGPFILRVELTSGNKLNSERFEKPRPDAHSVTVRIVGVWKFSFGNDFLSPTAAAQQPKVMKAGGFYTRQCFKTGH